MTDLTAAGVPLRNMATKRSAKDSFAMRPPLTIACTMKMPNTGKTTIFNNATDTIAMIGSRDSGLGTRSRAKAAPSRISASGTAMFPTKLAEEVVVWIQ